LADHLDISCLLEELERALTHQRMVVHDHDADRRRRQSARSNGRGSFR